MIHRSYYTNKLLVVSSYPWRFCCKDPQGTKNSGFQSFDISGKKHKITPFHNWLNEELILAINLN